MRDTTLVIIGLVSNAAGQLVLGLSSSTPVLFIGRLTGCVFINFFSGLYQLSMKYQLLVKTKMLKNKDFSCFHTPDHANKC